MKSKVATVDNNNFHYFSKEECIMVTALHKSNIINNIQYLHTTALLWQFAVGSKKAKESELTMQQDGAVI